MNPNVKLIKGAAVAGLVAVAISLGRALVPMGPHPDAKMVVKLQTVIGLITLVPWGILSFSALRFAPCLLAYLAVELLSMGVGLLGVNRPIYVFSFFWFTETILLAGTLLAMAKTNVGSVRKGLWVLFAASAIGLVMLVFNVAGMAGMNGGGAGYGVNFAIARVFSYLMKAGMLAGWLFLLVDSSTHDD